MSSTSRPPSRKERGPSGAAVAVRAARYGAFVKTEIVRSQRRRKTIAARMVGDTLRVMVPTGLSAEEEEHWATVMADRIALKTRSDHVDLTARAGDIAAAYDLPVPSQIRFSSRQRQRWGSCTPATGTVRISDRLLECPPWVLDYVIVHELAHLLEPNHTDRFWELVDRYALAERARGFLLGFEHAETR